MIKTYTIKPGQTATPEQLAEIAEAKKQEIVFDDDCEELSPAMVKALKCTVVKRNRSKQA